MPQEVTSMLTNENYQTRRGVISKIVLLALAHHLHQTSLPVMPLINILDNELFFCLPTKSNKYVYDSPLSVINVRYLLYECTIKREKLLYADLKNYIVYMPESVENMFNEYVDLLAEKQWFAAEKVCVKEEYIGELNQRLTILNDRAQKLFYDKIITLTYASLDKLSIEEMLLYHIFANGLVTYSKFTIAVNEVKSEEVKLNNDHIDNVVIIYTNNHEYVICKHGTTKHSTVKNSTIKHMYFYVREFDMQDVPDVYYYQTLGMQNMNIKITCLSPGYWSLISAYARILAQKADIRAGDIFEFYDVKDQKYRQLADRLSLYGRSYMLTMKPAANISKIKDELNALNVLSTL